MGVTRDRSFALKMLAMVTLGFSSGAPFLVTRDIVKAWLTDSGVDLASIGLFSLVALPYTFKFVWSPILDRFSAPAGSFLGRRRGWMLLTQIALLLTIAILGQTNPKESMTALTVICVAIAFFSATQDIVLDAFRREYLTDQELGLGTGIWINTYRLATLASVGIAFALADSVGYENVFLILALFMSVGIVTTFLVSEPVTGYAPPRTLSEAVIEPFTEFFRRKSAFLVLAFILLYKIGDNMAGAMNVPFILKLGFEKTEYFLIVKGVGMIALFGGMFLAGVLMTMLGIARSLWIFGALQMVSTAAFALLVGAGHNIPLLTGVVVFELFSTGLGATAYSTFIAIQTHRRFTATQFALMTSLMAVPGTVAASVTGFIAEGAGWAGFYIICALSALPGMILLLWIGSWKTNRVLNQTDGSAEETTRPK